MHQQFEFILSLDKLQIMRETRSFNYPPVDPKSCMQVLTRIIYLLHQGDIVLSTYEATEIFFNVTKLFQLENSMLRRLVYLCLKELSAFAQDVIIVTSSLTKDMTRGDGSYRGAAARALISIADSALVPNLDRYLKEAMVDKDPSVQSAALVSALHLTASRPELARRWITEAQEAIMSCNPMVSYHALALTAEIRRDDKVYTAKFVTKFCRTCGCTSAVARSPYALCLLIRLAARLAGDDAMVQPEQFVHFIESCLHHKSEIVIFEAIHALVCLREPRKYLPQAVSILREFFTSSSAVMRLAAMRIVEKIARKYPQAVSFCSANLVNSISDSNKAVATLAVTILLKTGAANSYEIQYQSKLLAKLDTFMSELTDEYKIMIMQAMKSFCLQFPLKYKIYLEVFVVYLKSPGGLLCKKMIFEAMHYLIKGNPSSRELGLDHLSEYIENCEYSSLCVDILNVLGKEAPKTSQPLKYLRTIYNRVELETAAVRAAAVAAMARIAAARPALLRGVQRVLARCLLDDDDEVRDRAILYNAILESGDSNLINDNILNVTIPDMIGMEKLIVHRLDANPDEALNLDKFSIDKNTAKGSIKPREIG